MVVDVLSEARTEQFHSTRHKRWRLRLIKVVQRNSWWCWWNFGPHTPRNFPYSLLLPELYLNINNVLFTLLLPSSSHTSRVQFVTT